MQNQKEIVNELLAVIQQIKRGHQGSMPDMPIRKSEMIALMSIGNLMKEYPDGIKQGSLSQILNLAPPTVTPMINTLEENGFIERVGSKEDRRVVYIRLTKMGQEFLDEKENHFISNITELVEYLGEEDAKTFIRIVRKTGDFLNQKTKENEGNISD